MTAAARDMPNWPRLMSTDLAARYVGLSATYLRENGPKPKEVGRRRLYDIRDLDEWADALSGLPLDDPARKREGDRMADRIAGRIKRGKNRSPVHLRKPQEAEKRMA